MVESQEVTIKKAAIYLQINYSTAKHIVKQHKLNGGDLGAGGIDHDSSQV